MIELKVRFDEIEKNEKELEVLLKKIENKRLNIVFSNTKGAVADEVIEAANQLNQIADAMQTLIEKTKRSITNSRVMFEEEEKQSKQNWNSVGK